MDGRFLNAFTLLPTQRVICGYTTKPICLRHRIVFHQVDSPFLTGVRVPTETEVLMAAKILSFTTMEDMLLSKVTDEDIKWVKDMTEDPGLMLEQCEQIGLTIQEQAQWPIFWSSKSGGKDQGVPWVLNVITNLVKNSIPLEQAWTMPESQAVWLHAAFGIASGSETEIVSEEDRMAQEQLKRLEEEYKTNPPPQKPLKALKPAMN
jgi:hypothetical protein